MKGCIKSRTPDNGSDFFHCKEDRLAYFFGMTKNEALA
jgi:hypothetical protein